MRFFTYLANPPLTPSAHVNLSPCRSLPNQTHRISSPFSLPHTTHHRLTRLTGLVTSAARPSARYQGRALFSSPLSTAHAAAPARPGTVDMRNGDKVALPFTAQEYDRRVGRARGVMEDLALDGMVLTSMQNVTYHSGFTYCSFGRNYALVLGPASSAGSPSAGSGHKDSGVTVSAGIDGGQPHRRCHGDNLTYTDWGRDNFFSTVCSALTPAAFGPGKVRGEESEKKEKKRECGWEECVGCMCVAAVG